ncbi:PTS lactose transporter subunit IIB [Lactobacillus sp. ESL0791]|uniref:PTS lactose transporter subunit IIB n=1 Tax=Lactobacillus sp. ESL0791 TaxID=2983234 RepID=UPI0023F63656|nr:PTS lactose transporter subunit IIB [Lactobacillus sp. ESL0791]MDF7638010.1 PTS lactose transporter subunit IIB [Lactobacillus sp. ESL0791]
MKKKTVIVCCASSMITSTIAAGKVRDIAKKIGAPEPRIIQCKFSEVQGNIETNEVDLIVPTGRLNENVTGNVPMVLGTPFITGVNVDGAEQKIAEILKN